MEQQEQIEKAIKQYMQSDLLQLKLLGSGANGNVYWCKLQKEPFELAVKVTNYSDMMKKEANTINFINQKVDIKLPKIYFCHIANDDINLNIMGMSFINGISADKINWLFKGKKKKAFANDVIDNFLKLQQVTNNQYGVVGGEQFETWMDYYRPFAKQRLDYIFPLAKDGKFPQFVADTLLKAYENLDIILKDTGKATLTHGDYWVPNLLVNKDNLQFVGCVDPFNLMWAESEYEIFAMILYPKFKLYKTYKSRVQTSELCDLKARMYALFSEVYWFELLGKGSFGFMTWVAKKMQKLFKKHKIWWKRKAIFWVK